MNLSSQQIEIELVELHSFNSNTLEIEERNGKPLHEKHTGS